MSLQYVVYDYWEYGYAEGDALLEFGSASVTAEASVSANGTRIQFGNANVAAFATVTATGIRIQFGAGSITGNASFEAQGIRVRTASGAIAGEATVSALGGVVYSGSGAITGVASVVCYPNAVWGGNAAINASVTVSANGQVIGEEWADVPVVPNVWFSNKLFDPYVEIDYWEDGYTDDRYDYWIKQSSVQNNWVRQ
jgi:hypothetical protein